LKKVFWPNKNNVYLLTNPLNLTTMPVQKVPGGWRWGQSGKVYPTKAQAEAQGKAIYASGYKEKTETSKKK
jgi:hypothetical protein